MNVATDRAIERLCSVLANFLDGTSKVSIERNGNGRVTTVSVEPVAPPKPQTPPEPIVKFVDRASIVVELTDRVRNMQGVLLPWNKNAVPLVRVKDRDGDEIEPGLYDALLGESGIYVTFKPVAWQCFPVTVHAVQKVES